MPTPALTYTVTTPAKRPYLGVVATRCHTCSEDGGGGNLQMMSRTRHISRDTISSIQAAFPNWRVSQGGGETGMGSTAVITASIEYPVGVFTQLLFSGIAAGSCAAGVTLVSDAANVRIPDNTAFFVRVYYANTTGIPYNFLNDSGNGERLTFGAVVVDQTMSGTVVNTSSGVGYGPVAIIAMTTRKTVGIIGDSRAKHFDDSFDGTSTALGEIARSVEAYYGWINIACRAELAQTFVANSAFRKPLMNYCSHLITQFGINDIANARSPAQIIADLASIRGLFPGKPFYVCTLPLESTSTDSWATLANQTIMTQSANRISFNNSVRLKLPGTAGFFELADQVESARDSGKWKVDGTAFKYTTDGVHETQFADLLIQAANVINI